jgi:hypothetical protein
MRKIRTILFVIFIIVYGGIVKSAESPDSIISSVLTVSPGNELYSTFGHTAIRIRDLKNKTEFVFNYGTFDFNTPNFYLKFAAGKLDYMLSVESFESFMELCRYEERSVKEQTLNFNANQNARLFQLLVESYKPENRYYRYKFFTDNCCTRVRDIIVKASGDSTLLMKPEVEATITFRTLFTKHLKYMPWSRFGIELVLGKMTDEMSGYNSLFLPDNLEKSISLAKIDDKKLVSDNNILVSYDSINGINNISSPFFIMVLVLFSSFIIQLKKQWISNYDKVFYSVLGLLGLFVFFLSIFSEHAELHYNLVIIFLLPSNIILPFLKPSSFRKYYCILALAIIISGIISLPFLPQKFNFAFIIMVVALGVRLFFNIIKLKNETKF